MKVTLLLQYYGSTLNGPRLPIFPQPWPAWESVPMRLAVMESEGKKYLLSRAWKYMESRARRLCREMAEEWGGGMWILESDSLGQSA